MRLSRTVRRLVSADKLTGTCACRSYVWPDKTAAQAELADVKKRDKEVTAQHNQKMKGACHLLSPHHLRASSDSNTQVS